MLSVYIFLFNSSFISTIKEQKATHTQNTKFHLGAQNWLRQCTVCFGFVCLCARESLRSSRWFSVHSQIKAACSSLLHGGYSSRSQNTTSKAFPSCSHWGRPVANLMAHKGVLCNTSPPFSCRVRLHCVSIQSEKKNLKSTEGRFATSHQFIQRFCMKVLLLISILFYSWNNSCSFAFFKR